MTNKLTNQSEFGFMPEENTAQPAEQSASPDIDLNELLSSMDGASADEIVDGDGDIPESDISDLLSRDDDPETAVTPEQQEDPAPADTEDAPPKPKRASRKKKDPEPEPDPEPEDAPEDVSDDAPGDDIFNGDVPEDGTEDAPEETPTEDGAGEIPEKPKRPVRRKKEPDDDSSETEDSPKDAPTRTAKRPVRKRTAAAPVLTIESRAEVDTPENQEETAWHEIRNAYRTRKILTGTLGGIEQTETGKTVAIVNYNDFRVVIPMKEMMINLNRSPSGPEYDDLMLRQNKILGNMLGTEIDFIVKGIESKTRSIVASRKDAMMKKRQLFYLNTDASGMYRIYEGRVVQARVIAVAEKVIRIEAFGVECSIMARDLSWDWLGDAHERFSVGDQILVRILSVTRNSLEDISIRADVKSVSDNTSFENLKKCRVQSKYAGKVTDVHKGVVYIRLSNGVNAIAHSCYDRRMPGKKDDVSFAVTRIDAEQGVAVGIITRIIKQNL